MIRDLNYRCNVAEPPGFNSEHLPKLIEETHHRLTRVQIECQLYEKVLKRFDGPEALFYLDPPYFGINLYRFVLEDTDFLTMATRLATLKGKFVLSLNDVPEVRRIFKQFKFRQIDLHYTAQKVAGRCYKEVLITNF